ncbi:MAG: fibronectin type III, partial [Bacteroidia bacterium]|nr:fibronectin type III [Bacteroidia bacterium]
MNAWIQQLMIPFFLGFTISIMAQTVLEADGPGTTYELINSVLAPGYNVVENPECVHPQFGRHIAEVWDAELNKYVFEFYIHVTPDNDRCINFDRQRMEIKTYDSSPDNLLGVSGETVVYKWKFRIPTGFLPSTSFTHIHQIKAVGGDADDPIFTLTVRKASPNRVELIHNNTTKVATAPLALF